MLISQINTRSAPPCCFDIKVSQLLSVTPNSIAILHLAVKFLQYDKIIYDLRLSTPPPASEQEWDDPLKKVARAGPNFSPGEFRLVKLTQKFRTRGGGGG